MRKGLTKISFSYFIYIETYQKEGEMTENKTNWSRLNNVVKKKEAAKSPTVFEDKGNLVRQNEASNIVPAPESVIAGFKGKKIAKQAGLKNLQDYYKAQGEVFKEMMRQKQHTGKEEIAVEAGRFLLELNERHLGYITEFGLVNIADRQKAMLQLNEQSSEMLKKVEKQDIPEPMKDQTVAGIWKLHNDFFNKLVQEIAELEAQQ